MSVLGIVSADRPCWVLDLGHDYEPHFTSYREAQEFAAELGGGSPRELAGRCWTVTCTECDEPYEDEDAGGDVHFDSFPQVATNVDAAGWRLAGWSLLCPNCIERLDMAYTDRQTWALPFAPHPDQLALFDAFAAPPPDVPGPRAGHDRASASRERS